MTSTPTPDSPTVATIAPSLATASPAPAAPPPVRRSGRWASWCVVTGFVARLRRTT
ncbi:MAG: hypothetical protein ABW219_02560 [Ilumatobacteraceae bacterium]